MRKQNTAIINQVGKFSPEKFVIEKTRFDN